MITDIIKRKIKTIVGVFETSSVTPRYGIVTLLRDGPKDAKGAKQLQITYGAHQTTETSHLKELLTEYCNSFGKCSTAIRPYLSQIGKYTLHQSGMFLQLLRSAGDDPVMQELQEKFFEKRYWVPAYNFFTANKFTLPLSMAVVYDSYIHSGGLPAFLRDDFPEVPPSKGGSEKAFINAYVNARDYWLEHHPDKILRNTDYRTDAWQEQVKNSNWHLSQSVVIKFNSNDPKEWITVK